MNFITGLYLLVKFLGSKGVVYFRQAFISEWLLQGRWNNYYTDLNRIAINEYKENVRI